MMCDVLIETSNQTKLVQTSAKHTSDTNTSTKSLKMHSVQSTHWFTNPKLPYCTLLLTAAKWLSIQRTSKIILQPNFKLELHEYLLFLQNRRAPECVINYHIGFGNDSIMHD